MTISEIVNRVRTGRMGSPLSQGTVEELLREFLTILNTYPEGEVQGFIRRYTQRTPKRRREAG